MNIYINNKLETNLNVQVNNKIYITKNDPPYSEAQHFSPTTSFKIITKNQKC